MSCLIPVTERLREKVTGLVGLKKKTEVMISMCSCKREHLVPSDLRIMEKRMLRTDGSRLSAVALKI